MQERIDALMAEIEAPMSDIMDAAMQTIGSFTDESVATDLDVLTDAYFLHFLPCIGFSQEVLRLYFVFR